jgi:hypothetical protein
MIYFPTLLRSNAMHSSCVENLRYAGKDPAILETLLSNGLIVISVIRWTRACDRIAQSNKRLERTRPLSSLYL